jgi:hypothetical protein
MFFWSTGTNLLNCTSWHSIRPYIIIHCSEILNSHIFVSKLNTSDFTIQFNSSCAERTVIYADIVLHYRATMKSLNNFKYHTWFVEHYVGNMEPFAPWLVVRNLDYFNQCTLMRVVSVIAIYRICDFNLVFKLSTSEISTNPCTVVHTNVFPTSCTIYSFDFPTCFGLKPELYSGGYSTWVNI